jgi:hypothetical protein
MPIAMGDPTCVLAIAWTLLDKEGRKIFKSCLEIDLNTSSRARGWALWKALIELEKIADKNSFQANFHKIIITEIIYNKN